MSVLSFLLAVCLAVAGDPDPQVMGGSVQLSQKPPQGVMTQNLAGSSGFEAWQSQDASRFEAKLTEISRLMGHNLQTDPMGYADSMNLYQGFNMNPQNFTDPMGEAVRPGVHPEAVRSAYEHMIMQGVDPEDAMNRLVEYKYIDTEPIYQLSIALGTEMKSRYALVGVMAFELSPAGTAKDSVSAVVGKDLLWKNKLKWWERTLYSIPIIGGGLKILKMNKVAKIAEAVDLMKDVEKTEKLIATAEKLEDAVTYEGYIFRFNKADHMDTVWKIGSWNIKSSHRYSRVGIGAMYSSTDALTAWKEARKSADTLLEYRKIKISGLCDLTNPRVLEKFGFDYEDITNWMGKDKYMIPQRIGEKIKEMGYKGILAPSARQEGGINLILFEEL